MDAESGRLPTITALSLWLVGWVAGAVVVLLVAALILAITFLARKVDGESLTLTSPGWQA